MRKLTFKCVITSEFTPFLDLQQQNVILSQNGTTWSGSLAADVEDTLNIAATVNGINGSAWKVDITIDCPDGSAAKIFSRSGAMPHGGTQGFRTSAKVPQDPCNQARMALMEAEPPPQRKISKKKKSKQRKPTPKTRRQ